MIDCGRRDDARPLVHPLRDPGRIEAPVLLLWCKDDRVIDYSAADIFERGLRRSETVILTGCGHMPMMAQPGNVSTALRRFVSGG